MKHLVGLFLSRGVIVWAAAILIPACGGSSGGGSRPRPGTLAFLSGSVSGGEGTTLTVTVRRTGGSRGAASVSYAMADGAAVAPVDYLSAAGVLNWADGDAADRTIQIPLAMEANVEGDETFTVTLSGATGASLGAPAAAIVTIQAQGAADVTPPTVLVRHPDSGAVGVARNTNISATFSEDMSPASLTPASFSVSGGVTGTVTYDAVSRTALFIPDADLAASTLFTVTLSTAVSDTAGITLAAPSVWSFTTGVGNDTTAPSVSSALPADGATQVSLATHQKITFSEPMDRAATNAAISLSPAPLYPLQFLWEATGDVVWVVFDTVSPPGISGTDLLVENTAYTVTVGFGAKDLAGNPLAAADSVTWTTRTDATPPILVSISPDQTTTVPAGTTVYTLTFNEPMDTTVGSAWIDGPNVTFQEDVGGPQNSPDMDIAWASATQFTITLLAPLPAGRAYDFVMGQMRDTAGNKMTNQNPYDDLEFGKLRFPVVTAGPGTDLTPPTITARWPAPGGVNVSRQTDIFIGFSEPMSADMGAHVNVSGAGATEIEAEYNFGATLLNLRPRKAWPASTTLTVTVSNGMKDAAGNAIAGTSWSFTTAAANVNPMVPDYAASGISPGSVDLDPALGLYFFLRFKETGASIMAVPAEQTLAPENMVVQANTTVALPLKGYRLRYDEFSLYVEPLANTGAAPLLSNTTYTVTLLSTLVDNEDVPIVQTSFSFTTAVAATNCRPLVIGNEASYFATGAGARADLWVNFKDQDADTFTVEGADDLDGNVFGLTGSVYLGVHIFDYSSGGVEAGLDTPGAHRITFTVDDGTALPGHIVTIEHDAFLFEASLIPSVTAPAGGANTTATPTFTWAAFPANLGAHILVLKISEDPSGDSVYDVLLDPSTTSYTLPADRALAPGDYKWSVAFFHLTDIPQDTAGFGATGSETFTVGP